MFKEIIDLINNNRGTGNTKSLIQSIKDGPGMVVFATHSQTRHAEKYVYDGGSSAELVTIYELQNGFFKGRDKKIVHFDLTAIYALASEGIKLETKLQEVKEELRSLKAKLRELGGAPNYD